MTALLGGGSSVEELHSENSALVWREICDVRLLDGDGGNGRQVWRLSVPPMNGAGVAEQLTAGTGASVFYDWGGGLIWLTMDATPDAGHETVRRAVEAAGGHATLVRAGADVRNRVPVFEPQTEALRGITARIKEGFDPKGILNPGRMVEGV